MNYFFDLDNTLYDGATKVFDQVDKKMSKFISDKLNVSIEEAKKIQKNYLILVISIFLLLVFFKQLH